MVILEGTDEHKCFFFILLPRGFLFLNSVILFRLKLSVWQLRGDAGPWPVWQQVQLCLWHWEPGTSLTPPPSLTPFSGASQGGHTGAYDTREKIRPLDVG